MSSSAKRGPPAPARPRKWLVILLLIAALLAASSWLVMPGRLQGFLQQALAETRHLGAWAPVIFILLYIACCVALVPAAILTVGAGAVFGGVQGSVYVSIGATLGATAAFLLGRYAARAWVGRRLAAYPRFAAVDEAVAEEGWRIVFLTRLCPLFPFFLLNYAYGLTRVSLRDYILATWIGIMPGSTLFVYLGSLANHAGQRNSAIGWTKTGFVLGSSILALVFLTRIARRALAKRLDPPVTEICDGKVGTPTKL